MATAASDRNARREDVRTPLHAEARCTVRAPSLMTTVGYQIRVLLDRNLRLLTAAASALEGAVNGGPTDGKTSHVVGDGVFAGGVHAGEHLPMQTTMRDGCRQFSIFQWPRIQAASWSGRAWSEPSDVIA